jgi:hypothetical protein
MVQAAVWIRAAITDRLTDRVAWLATAAWLAMLAGLLVCREAVRLSAVDLEPLLARHEESAGIGGLPVFVVCALLVTATIIWCVASVRRGLYRERLTVR